MYVWSVWFKYLQLFTLTHIQRYLVWPLQYYNHLDRFILLRKLPSFPFQDWFSYNRIKRSDRGTVFFFFFFCSAIDRPGLICLWFFTSGHTHYVLTTLNVTVDHFKFLGNCPPNPSQLNTYLSLRVKCWLREKQGEKFPRNLNCLIVAPANISRKVMLHGTIFNATQPRNTGNNVITIRNNVATIKQRCVALKIIVANPLV